MILKSKKQSGFTIVELMVALAALAVMLLIGTVILIQISNTYTKGVNTTSVQNADRTILRDLTSDLQFSNGITAPCVGANSGITSDGTSYCNKETVNGATVYENTICIGDVRYTYALNEQVEASPVTNSNQVYHGLWRDVIANGDDCTPANINTPSGPNYVPAMASDNGQDLVPEGNRLESLSINVINGNTYQVSTELAFGDDNLLSQASRGANATNIDHGYYGNCLGDGNGDQFCATSQLDTLINPRL